MALKTYLFGLLMYHFNEKHDVNYDTQSNEISSEQHFIKISSKSQY